MDVNKFYNKILGDRNLFFQDAENNNIHIGDIILNKATKNRSVNCPRCKTPASESTKEEEVNYTAFTCIKCGHRFYEHDEIADNISSYVDLNGEEAKRFKRLIEAVNHDLHAGEIVEAYSRCQKNKEIYGRTPQIYEWGAFTLFLTKPINYWVDNSLRSVLAYLEKSRQLDENSETYNKIAASIATRYYQGLMRRIDNLKNSKPGKPEIDKKNTTVQEIAAIQSEHEQNLTLLRKETFAFLLEVETCYQIYPDLDFLKVVLTELYGYGGMAWYEKKLVSFFKKPTDDPSGKIRLMKGYVWDYYKIMGNSDRMFENYRETPSSFAVKIEAILKNKVPNQEFSEIRVGSILSDSPLSASASLKKYLIGALIILVVIAGILIWQKMFWLLAILILAVGLFGYFKDKDGNTPDELRRLTNQFTNRF